MGSGKRAGPRLMGLGWIWVWFGLGLELVRFGLGPVWLSLAAGLAPI